LLVSSVLPIYDTNILLRSGDLGCKNNI
jgi:hypothetical protein